MHNWLIPAGGVAAGTGIVCMLFGFEATTGKDFAVSYAEVGYSGILQFAPNTAGLAGMALLAVGVVLMIAGNRTAWTKTGGY